MDGLAIVALLAILGAIVCFLIDTVKSGFSLISLGLLFLSIFFLLSLGIPERG